jgi:hypothetical protein
MRKKLAETKWYLADYKTGRVLTDRRYSTFSEARNAVPPGQKQSLFGWWPYTGQHLMRHEGQPWIIPAPKGAS